MTTESHFLNVQMGYNLRKVDSKDSWAPFLAPTVIYEFTLDSRFPLTFVDSCGVNWQPDRTFQTDMGSIPRFAQKFIGKDEFLLSFLFHDSAYIHGGLWTSLGGDVHFRKMQRDEVDDLCLRDMIFAEDGGILRQWLVYRSVRLFGGSAWGRGDRRKDATSSPQKVRP